MIHLKHNKAQQTLITNSRRNENNEQAARMIKEISTRFLKTQTPRTIIIDVAETICLHLSVAKPDKQLRDHSPCKGNVA